MGLCKYCKSWVSQCGTVPAHCMDRTSEKFISCDLNTGFRPFMPKENCKYSREYIITKWTAYVQKTLAEKGA